VTGLDRELAAARELADLADGLTLPAFEQGIEATVKDDGSWVTRVDHEVERLLRRELRSRFPDHAVLGEEDGLDGPDGAPTWVVDPIDGTTNFVKGNPVFATLIALRHAGEELVGVVSAPALHGRWEGVRDGPARYNGREIRVSSVDDLARAEVAFGGLRYFSAAGLDGLVEQLVRRTRRQRGYGDFWQHCLVAAGSTDVALEARVNLWDLAAVRCVVLAAGGRFTSLAGDETADGGSALSSNGHLHDQVLALIGEHTPVKR